MAGVVTGLDYARIEAGARLAGLAPTPEDFARLRIMEAEAMKALAERRES